MGIREAADSMERFDKALGRVDKTLSSLNQGSGGITRQQALGGEGATALPGGSVFTAFIRQVFSALGVGGGGGALTVSASQGGGGGGGLTGGGVPGGALASVSAHASEPGIRGARNEPKNPFISDQRAPTFLATPFSGAAARDILRVLEGIRSDAARRSLNLASTRSSR